MTSLSDTLDDAAHSVPFVLDGAIGTELDARGFSTDRPGWSAAVTWEDPELLAAIHRDYVDAGADVVTANTFRMHGRSLERVPSVPSDVVSQSVDIARSANARFVVGSVGPLEDCYRPDLTPPDRDLIREHAVAAERLADAGVDGVLLETMPTMREAVAAMTACQRVGLPVLASLWPAATGVLGDGTPVAEAAKRLATSGAVAVLVNCVPADDVAQLLAELRNAAPRFGAYANTSRQVDGQWQATAAADPEAYGQVASTWAADGACVIGGCCGTTPDHIRQIRRRIGSLTTPE